MLVVENLHVEVSGQKILKGLNLTVKKGEIHAIMGPNGSGKSTLSKVVSGHPDYEITQGRVLFQGQDIIKIDPTERALMGIFMGLNHFIVRVLLLSVREWILIRLNKQFLILKITSLSIMVFIEDLLD